MKKALYLYIICCIGIIGSICLTCNDDPGQASGGIPDDGEGEENESLPCCSDFFGKTFSVDAPAGGSYYWIAMFDPTADTIVKVGEEYIYLEEGTHDSVVLAIRLYSYDDIDPGSYPIRIYCSESENQIGFPEDGVLVSGLGNWDVIRQGDPCLDCCCPGKAFIGYVDSVLYPEELRGVSCSILTAYPNKLCGDDPHDTTLTFSAVWCELYNWHQYPYNDINGLYWQKSWSQLGVIAYRQSTYNSSPPFDYIDTDTLIGYYFETKGYRRFVDIINYPQDINGELVYPPGNNSLNHYMITRQLEDQISVFWYWFNGYRVGVDVHTEEDDPIWFDNYASHMQWSGELAGLQTDLFGTETNKCKISACSYINTFDTVLISTQATQLGEIGSSNSNEWGIEIENDSTICIWDKNPR